LVSKNVMILVLCEENGYYYDGCEIVSKQILASDVSNDVSLC
jgi:hypothetical protein